MTDHQDDNRQQRPKMAQAGLYVRISIPNMGDVLLTVEHAQRLLVDLESEMAALAEMAGEPPKPTSAPRIVQ